MGQEKSLAHGARVSGALCLTGLALISLGWIIRDLTEARGVTDVWWLWSGLATRAESGLWVSSALDPVLLVVCTAAAMLALRSSSAAGILAATGLVTVILRAPGLWNLNAEWMQGIEDGLHTKALISAIAAVVLGLLLLLLAAAGRRPVEVSGYGYPAVFDTTEHPPPRPATGAAVTAAVFLAAMAAGLIAWEIHRWQRSGWEQYERTVTGERSLLSLLDTPSGWTAWALALLALIAAIAALAKSTFSRPLGTVVGGVLLGLSVFRISYDIKTESFSHLDALSTVGKLHVATDVLLGAAALVVLFALARHAAPDSDGLRDWPPAGAADGRAGPSGPGGLADHGSGGFGGHGPGGYGQEPGSFGPPPPPPPAQGPTPPGAGPRLPPGW